MRPFVAVTFDHAAGVMPLLPGTLYAYNVTITEDDGTTHDLRSLGLLQDKSITNGGSDGKAPIANEPLGYENGRTDGAIFDLQGALRSPTYHTPAWPELVRKPYADRLTVDLNAAHERAKPSAAAPGGELTIGPPLYGQWLAAAPEIDGTEPLRSKIFEIGR